MSQGPGFHVSVSTYRMLLHFLCIGYNPHKFSIRRLKGNSVCSSELHSKAWQSKWDQSHCQWKEVWYWRTPQVRWFWSFATGSGCLSPNHTLFLFTSSPHWNINKSWINNIYYPIKHPICTTYVCTKLDMMSWCCALSTKYLHIRVQYWVDCRLLSWKIWKRQQTGFEQRFPILWYKILSKLV